MYIWIFEIRYHNEVTLKFLVYRYDYLFWKKNLVSLLSFDCQFNIGVLFTKYTQI